jgi:hypothetical protein
MIIPAIKPVSGNLARNFLEARKGRVTLLLGEGANQGSWARLQSCYIAYRRAGGTAMSGRDELEEFVDETISRAGVLAMSRRRPLSRCVSDGEQ